MVKRGLQIIKTNILIKFRHAQVKNAASRVCTILYPSIWCSDLVTDPIWSLLQTFWQYFLSIWDSDLVVNPIWPIFELCLDMFKTNILTKMVTLGLQIIKTNILIKIRHAQVKNAASRVCTRLYPSIWCSDLVTDPIWSLLQTFWQSLKLLNVKMRPPDFVFLVT